jgi:U3 small nucleolar RNA-associated protein 23
MKGSKHKKFRNNLSFYEYNFDFRPPYTFLLDGNFIARAQKINLDLPRKMKQIFKKKRIYFNTTKCVKNELNLLGSQFSEIQLKASEFRDLHCFHEMAIEPSLCIAKHVGNTNKRQLVVCTCDEKLIKELEKIPKVPIFTFVSDNVLEMREPSKVTRKLLEKNEGDKYGVEAHEREKVDQFKKSVKEDKIKRGIQKFRDMHNKLGVKVKKRAKGANPLSMKRKKRRNKNVKKGKAGG